MSIKVFCFNPFYENTYILYKNSGEAWIFDPGCSNSNEEEELTEFIIRNKLHLSRLFLTHAHIDHILGLNFIYKKYGLKAEMHALEEVVMQSAPIISTIYNINYNITPTNNTYIKDNQVINYFEEEILCLWTPGHSPGSLCYYMPKSKSIISGDVLFEGSIGRTDLPGGDYQTLLNSIKNKLFPLGGDIIVYPGHGGKTTIGREKLTNPFLKD